LEKGERDGEDEKERRLEGREEGDLWAGFR